MTVRVAAREGGVDELVETARTFDSPLLAGVNSNEGVEQVLREGREGGSGDGKGATLLMAPRELEKNGVEGG